MARVSGYWSAPNTRPAVSRKSMKVVRPSARRISMKPPPPMLPALGWVTAREGPTAMYSPQSQKLIVGSDVRMNTVEAMRKTAQPK